MRQYYTAVRFTEYDSANSFKLKSDDIEVTAPAQTGWICSWGQHGNMVSITKIHLCYLSYFVDEQS